jgi:hypothetical protein
MCLLVKALRAVFNCALVVLLATFGAAGFIPNILASELEFTLLSSLHFTLGGSLPQVYSERQASLSVVVRARTWLELPS